YPVTLEDSLYVHLPGGVVGEAGDSDSVVVEAAEFLKRKPEA
ncbi:hypothetical protein GWI33_013484, partial [Rhynchophorus ferrugineus]